MEHIRTQKLPSPQTSQLLVKVASDAEASKKDQQAISNQSKSFLKKYRETIMLLTGTACGLTAALMLPSFKQLVSAYFFNRA